MEQGSRRGRPSRWCTHLVARRLGSPPSPVSRAVFTRRRRILLGAGCACEVPALADVLRLPPGELPRCSYHLFNEGVNLAANPRCLRGLLALVRFDEGLPGP